MRAEGVVLRLVGVGVEAAGKSTFAPDDDDATLGKLIRNDSRVTIHHLTGMVWRSEFDRHGTDDPEVLSE
ncbi:hypothetical protein [Isoptericola luteus]|uniref:hypothetical protein n=1 Tax=Isoptericola luteus TaxID=2879484 RepID=UPI001CE058BF|nr:hypothetical protein [Isoptericola sp. NEAU-Y5]